MDLGNCPECGKIYVVNPSRLCPACMEKEEEYELKIVEYMREHGKASVEEIKEATGVKESAILRMMKQGRFVGNYVIDYPCEVCGTPINEGRVCAGCSKNIMNQMKDVPAKEAKKKEEPSKKGGRMYSRDDD